ncbi:MAG: VCBS repeat-containing protein [Cyclobacteriaceae bacterium]|nr:VCBS repeat-containing protein [Cyclobacteriaceae bacterium HetDA_MAG_MS6]
MKIYPISLLVLVMACNTPDQPLFTQPQDTGIDFQNTLANEKGFDVFRYRNYYNGGGVAIGDVNNDGLSDVYFTSNQESNRLYLNKGEFTFDDVTEKALVAGEKPWSTGVAMADINGDGWLDIYVCNSGDPKGDNRDNELFINNQDETFTESAESYGLNDQGFSTHAAFFDFDHDGDLDCYLLNNSFRPVSSLPIENTRDQRDRHGGDKFYLNDDGKFIDVSDQVGVFGSVIGFGLGITLMDINEDYWTDIYVSNDFFERDYLYINQGGKHFTEELEKYFDQISVFSMGADAADLNNDGLEEVFVTDMLPPDYKRLKQTTSFDSWDLQQLKFSRGFYHQYMKNTMQLNNGDGSFSEVGRLMGVDATDWSWGTLLFDMDNDGLKDIYITNGIYKDVTDQDFIAYFSSEENMKKAKGNVEEAFSDFDKRMPSTPLANYAFKLDSIGKYQNVADVWGLAKPSFSNGAAYGDLDNDGDLDVVVNNINQPASVYLNHAEEIGHHFLRLKLTGKDQNPFAIGAEVKAVVGDQIITYHHYPTRGFQSSMDYVITLGLGASEKIDRLEIRWDEQWVTALANISADTTLVLSVSDAEHTSIRISEPKSYFKKLSTKITHLENQFVDFDRERLIYQGLSKEGPCLAKADLNADGLDDFYFGGAKNSPGKIYLNTGADQFVEQFSFDGEASSEDVDAVFFDADADGDQDLYVVSGGNDSFNQDDYLDRLYINIGTTRKPVFQRVALPLPPASGACVSPGDMDGDGDIDLFIGTRSIPGKYGKPASSYLLENDGKGGFQDVSGKYMNQLSAFGMVTDAIWLDYDQDKDQDLVVVGDWMAITLFENKGNFFQRKFNIPGLEDTEGWWRSVTVADINQDGLLDIVAGNLGLNSKFKASPDQPIKLFLGDYDENGTQDHIYTFYQDGKYIPYHLRSDLAMQLTMIKKKYPDFKSYADQSISDIFGEEMLSNTLQLAAKRLESMAFVNAGNGSFTPVVLPLKSQVSPIYKMATVDIEKDGSPELLAMGNFLGTKPEEGIYDANHGLLMSVGNKLTVIAPQLTGLLVRGDVRDFEILQGKNARLLLIGKNNDYAEIYSF